MASEGIARVAAICEQFVQDVRYAVRTLAARPGWTTAALLCLAIATGANTAAFTLVNGLLLRPLPFPEPDRLVMVAERETSQTTTRPFSLREYRELAADAGDTGQFLAWTFFPLSLSAGDGAQMAQAQVVSGNYFETLRVSPFAGRFFTADADRAGGEPSIVLSHDLWQRRFGADLSVIGTSVRVNGHPTTIAAVAPQGFVGAMQLISVDLWIPSALYPPLAGSASAADTPTFGVMGRLAPLVSLDAAAARLSSVRAAEARAHGIADPPTVAVSAATGFGVPTIVRGSVVSVSAFVFGIMALLIAVAAANVAALILAWGAGRTREIGVRLALGAGRARIARQLFTESLVLAVAGNLIGALAAVWLTQALVARISTPFSYVAYAVDVHPDVRVMLYAAAATMATAILCGFAPIRNAGRVDVIEILKRSGTVGRSRASMRTLNAMVVAQFAVSTTLLVGAGLLVRTYVNAQSTAPGFDTRNLVAATLDVDQVQLDEGAGRRFYDALTARLAALPGVAEVSLAGNAPLASGWTPVTVRSGTRDLATESAEPFAAGAIVVAPNYFRTIGVPILQGRALAAESARPLVAVVNETMAKRLAPEGSPLGRSFAVDGRGGDRIEVVGVVPDLKYRSFTELPQPVFYEPVAQRYSARMTALLRVQGDAALLLPAVRESVHGLNRNLAIVELGTVDAQIEAARSRRGGPTTVVAVICLLGLLLSVIGLCGVVSYGVRDRAREFGIRMALGARPATVQALVLRQGLGVIGLGVVVGGVASLGASQVLRRMLFGVGPRDPLTLAVVTGILVYAALVALYFPARWASRLDPAHTLRQE